jgi:hypothetical protein
VRLGLLLLSAVIIATAEQPKKKAAVTKPPPKQEMLARVWGWMFPPPPKLRTLQGERPGELFIVAATESATPRRLTKDGNYMSPIFAPNGSNTVYALSADQIVMIDVGSGGVQALRPRNGIVRLIGAVRDSKHHALAVVRGADSRQSAQIVSLVEEGAPAVVVATGREAVGAMLRDERVYEKLRLYTEKVEVSDPTGTLEWNNVFLEGPGHPLENKSKCIDAHCMQPSLSMDEQFVVYVRQK